MPQNVSLRSWRPAITIELIQVREGTRERERDEEDDFNACLFCIKQFPFCVSTSANPFAGLNLFEKRVMLLVAFA